ncbi:MAG: phage tail tube protein [Desulfosporosinus sp.]|nr:phage tail tube protein [Desulfosporosinus sp.]
MSFEANETINGLYGKVYDENGKEKQGTQEFEATVEFEKEAIKQAGVFMDSHKVMGGSGSGSMTQLKLDSRLQKQILENPTAKFNYVGKLADPTARGEEAVLLIGVSFNGAPLMGYSLGELVEVDLDFTFDNYRYLQSIE